MYEYDDPSRTLSLLDELSSLGFPDTAFRILHHFKEPTTQVAHRSYCETLVEEDGRFRTNSNRLVQRRLEMVLAMARAGGLDCPSSAQFEHLAHVALLKHPHDQRSLHEQSRSVKRSDPSAA